MAKRRDESPERQALREMVSGYLKDNPVKNGTDVNALMGEMMSVILEGSLDGEMMRNWVTPSMIFGTKKQIIVEMAITQNPYIPVMAA